MGNLPAVELEILFRQRFALNQPCAIEIAFQFFQLLWRETPETKARQRIGIHRRLYDQIVTDLADAIRLGFAQSLDRGLYFAQQRSELSLPIASVDRGFQALSPVD